MTYEKSCGAIIYTCVFSQIKYVLVQQLEGFHGFPKGHMENGETEVETAMREIYEEVGLKPTLIEGFRIYDEYLIPNKDAVKQVVYFLAEYKNQEISIQKQELLSASLVTYEQALELLEFESTRRMLKEANKYLSSL